MTDTKIHARPATSARPVKTSARRLHMLIAEDNPINQRALASLVALQGHTLRVVANGKEALAALDEERFDAVLMDIQMPQMDGLEATAAIRRREAEEGSRLPIVAVTTLTGAEDRQRCRAAGMDAHLGKPVVPHELEHVLACLFGWESGSATAEETRNGDEDAIDREAILERLYGNVDLLKELVELFAEDCPGWLAGIREHLQQRNAAGLRFVAHTLRGAIGNFNTGAAYEMAKALEEMGRSGDFTDGAAALGKLEAAIEQLQQRLTTLANGLVPETTCIDAPTI